MSELDNTASELNTVREILRDANDEIAELKDENLKLRYAMKRVMEELRFALGSQDGRDS